MRRRREHRACYHRRRRLPKDYVVNRIADALIHVLYFVFGFAGTILIPIRGVAGIGFILLLVLSAVYPEAAVYFLLWAFGVGLFISLIGPRLFDHWTKKGRGQLTEIRAASRMRLRDDVPTIELPDPDSVRLHDRLIR